MERPEISMHEILVYRYFAANPHKWIPVAELKKAVPTVAERTIRLHIKKWADAGLVDTAEVFPGHRYRWAENAKRNQSYLLRLTKANEVFFGNGKVKEQDARTHTKAKG